MTGSSREDVIFTSGVETCAAWLYRPPPNGRVVPLVVMAHGLAGTRTMRLDAYAERFVAAGYACLVFDYRHFGASGGLPRHLLSVTAQLEDWESAIAFGRSLDGVDPDLVVAWGTSFGGGHALSLGARDRRLAAVMAQCPFTDGIASSLAVHPLTSLRVTASAVRDLVRNVRGRAPFYLPAAAEPGATAFMTAPDALPGVRAIGGDEDDNLLTARSALDVLRYAPGRRTRHIAIPLFVALCEADTVAPSRTARRQVRRAPRVEIRTYPVGHFDIYLGEAFEAAVADQVAFLRTHVPIG